MAIGDVEPVPGCPGVHYVDTGMYDVAGYGSVYLLDAERPAVVDTGIGTDRERVLAALEQVGIDRADLELVLPTHVHLDHAGGAGFLAAACPNATVRIHERGARHLVDPSRLVEGTRAAVGEQWQYYAEPDPVPSDRIEPLAGGDVIDLGDRTLDVHHAPGHAPHQVVFHDADAGAVFTADAAGLWSPGAEQLFPTTPPPQFDLEAALADAEMIADLDPAVLCYGHFGPRPVHDDPLGTYADVLTDWVDRVRAVRADSETDEAAVERLAAESDLTAAYGERKGRAEIRLNARGALAWLD